MRQKHFPLLLALGFSALMTFMPLPALAGQYCHHQTGYVSWGIDEYELFGLTEEEIAEKFKGQLHYDKADHHAKFYSNGYGPQFIVTFTDKHVSAVQRLFIDGAGCNILGPVLSTKKTALEFSIDGLSKMSTRARDDEQRLRTARELLRKLESK